MGLFEDTAALPSAQPSRPPVERCQHHAPPQSHCLPTCPLHASVGAILSPRQAPGRRPSAEGWNLPL